VEDEPSTLYVALRGESHQPEAPSTLCMSLRDDSHQSDAPSTLYVSLRDDSHQPDVPSTLYVSLRDDSHQPKLILQGLSSTNWNLCKVRSVAARHINFFTAAVSLNKLAAKCYE
jgi:hypothetical protein